MQAYYINICFTLCAIVFLFLFGIIYIRKTKQRTNINFVNKIFATLFIVCLILVLLEFVMPYTISIRENSPLLNTIISKSYMYVWLLIDFLLPIYIFYLPKDIEKIEKKNHFKRNLLIGMIFVFLIPLLLVIFVPISYIGGSTYPYTISGSIVSIEHIIVFFEIFYILIYVVINNKKITNMNLMPLLVYFATYISVVTIQIFTGFEVNETGICYTALIIILYLTVESQDNKLVGEYSKSKEEAEISNRAITEFLINMSHEARTELNSILGFSNTLLEEDNLSEEKFREDLKNISFASSKLMDFINNILDISKIESGMEVLVEEDYNLEKFVFELNTIISTKMHKDNVKFSIDINEELPKEYHGDQQKLIRILTYIINNAIEYTDYGQVKLSIDGTKNENDLEFTFLVSNTGHTMLVENFAKDFKDFGKVDNEKNNSIDNIKLGLIVAKELINIMNGTIEFKNEKGQGSRYFINIKQKIVNEEKVGNIFSVDDMPDTTASSNEILDLSDKRVLIVDDSELNINIASKYLSQYKLKVDSTNNGKDCIEKVKNNHYDIIFLDHMMPEMDGLATIKALNENIGKLPPIIALTANSYDGLKREYISEGFYDYIKKPIEFKDLDKVVRTIFGKEVILQNVKSNEGGDVR